MPIIRVQKDKDHPYFLLNRAAVDDDRLSWKAVGLHTYLMSKPDNWTIREEDLINRHTDGHASIRSGLKELKKFGYIKTIPVRENNRIVHWETTIYESVPTDADVDADDASKPAKAQKNASTSHDCYNAGYLGCTKPGINGTEPIVSIENKEVRKTKSKKSKKLSSGEARSRVSGVSEKGLLKDPDAKPDFAVVAAKKLYTALAGKRKIMAQPNLMKWAATLRRFLASGQVDKKEFRQTLQWYIANIGQPFVPQAFSADAFVQKYVKIESAIARSKQVDSYDAKRAAEEAEAAELLKDLERARKWTKRST
jgi:hypothetical protein